MMIFLIAATLILMLFARLNIHRHQRHTPYAKQLQIKAQHDDDKTKRTAELLNKVFNSEHSANKTVSGSFLRRKVFEQYNLLLTQLNIYYGAVALPDEKTMAVERIKLLLKASSPYSGFMSWCILEDEELGPMLHDFIGVPEYV